MGPRIKIEMMRLCQSLIYMAAIYFCPSMRKRRTGEAGAGMYRKPLADSAASAMVAAAGVASQSPEGGARRAITVFGKVISSLPSSFQYVSTADVFIYQQYQQQYQDQLQEFGATPREERGPSAMNYARKAERFIKRGFDLLRLTQNLARGDLEAAAAH